MILSKLNAARIAYGVDRAVQANLGSPVVVSTWELATNATRATWLQFVSLFNSSGTVPTLGSDVHRTSAFSAVMAVISPRQNLPGHVSGLTATFAVTPATVTKAATQTQQLTIAGTDAFGNTGATDHYTYSTSDATKATVSATGLITAVATGSATITVHASNGVTHTCVVTIS